MPCRPRLRRSALSVLAFLPALFGGAAAPARATHAPDHRFIVLGYVTDATGRGTPRVPVVVTRLKTGLTYRTATEADGFYFVVVHLHDEDEGDPLKVTVAGASAEIRARFAVGDAKTERGTRLDFRGGKPTEAQTNFAETLRAYLAR
jgi:hypothetical protein